MTSQMFMINNVMNLPDIYKVVKYLYSYNIFYFYDEKTALALYWAATKVRCFVAVEDVI